MARTKQQAAAAASPIATSVSAPILDRVGDVVRLPLAALIEAAWNPKTPISGPYKAGLVASLREFGLRGPLDVWPLPAGDRGQGTGDSEEGTAIPPSESSALSPVPRPPSPTYVILDGNQRKPILAEAGLDPVPCLVHADLTPEQARLYTAAHDRNHAAYDEAKLADLAGSLVATSQDLVRRMLRVEVPLVPPPPREDMERVRDQAATAAADVMKVFSFTAEGAEELDELLVGFGNRLRRSASLLEAIRPLQDRDLTDFEAELALRILAARKNTHRN